MRATGLGLFLSVLMLVGCGGDDGGSPPVSTNPDAGGGSDNRCEDEDGDGAGYRCPLADCDDNDPEVTNECMRCRTPAEDCPCDEGTEAMFCTPEDLGDTKEENGQLLQCTEGQRYCREAVGVEEEVWVWTDCVGVYTLAE